MKLFLLIGSLLFSIQSLAQEFKPNATIIFEGQIVLSLDDSVSKKIDVKEGDRVRVNPKEFKEGYHRVVFQIGKKNIKGFLKSDLFELDGHKNSQNDPVSVSSFGLIGFGYLPRANEYNFSFRHFIERNESVLFLNSVDVYTNTQSKSIQNTELLRLLFGVSNRWSLGVEIGYLNSDSESVVVTATSTPTMATVRANLENKGIVDPRFLTYFNFISTPQHLLQMGLLMSPSMGNAKTGTATGESGNGLRGGLYMELEAKYVFTRQQMQIFLGSELHSYSERTLEDHLGNESKAKPFSIYDFEFGLKYHLDLFSLGATAVYQEFSKNSSSAGEYSSTYYNFLLDVPFNEKIALRIKVLKSQSEFVVTPNSGSGEVKYSSALAELTTTF